MFCPIQINNDWYRVEMTNVARFRPGFGRHRPSFCQAAGAIHLAQKHTKAALLSGANADCVCTILHLRMVIGEDASAH